MAAATPKQTDPTEKNGSDPVLDEDKVLDLMALSPTRRLVKIPTKRAPRGESFEMRLVDDFGIEDQQRLMAWARKYQNLMNSDVDLKTAEVERLKFILDELFDTVLDAPKTVKRDLPDSVKSRVVTVFSVGPLLARQEAQMEIIRRLVEKGTVSQDEVDQVMVDIREEVVQSTSGS